MTNKDNMGYKIISKREYIDSYANKEVFKELNKAAIIAYICTGLSIAANIIAYVFYKDSTFLFELIAPVIMLALTMGAQIKRNDKCAIVYTIIAGLNVVFGFMLTKQLVGIIPLIAGILMIKAFGQIEKNYNVFLKEQAHAFEMKQANKDQ